MKNYIYVINFYFLKKNEIFNLFIFIFQVKLGRVRYLIMIFGGVQLFLQKYLVYLLIYFVLLVNRFGLCFLVIGIIFLFLFLVGMNSVVDYCFIFVYYKMYLYVLYYNLNIKYE